MSRCGGGKVIVGATRDRSMLHTVLAQGCDWWVGGVGCTVDEVAVEGDVIEKVGRGIPFHRASRAM